MDTHWCRPVDFILPYIHMESKEYESDLSAFRRHLKNLRKDAGLSQTQLASLIGCTRVYISSIERGVKIPSLLNMMKLAKALKVEPSYLLEFQHLL